MLSFTNNLIQGPLAGISTAPFRKLIWQYSQPAFSCTEMISCKTILHQPRSSERFIKIDPLEGPVCFQLSGSNILELAEATKRITDYGAHLIDLNCGCPVNKIRSRGAGSSLLMKPTLIYELIRAMKQNTHLPVSIKIRVDGESADRYNEDIAKAVSDAGTDFITIHGRHWTEQYETSCRYDQIQYFVDTLKIPVIGNGDVACLNSFKKMLATGCSGAMIGRASVGQPWLIGQLKAEYQGKIFIPPSIEEICTIFIEHIHELSLLLKSEKFALLHARKLAKYYARSLPSRTEFCEQINRCEDLKTFQHLCSQALC